MADPDSSSAQKPHVYELLNHLNAAFEASIAIWQHWRRGIFDPLMIQMLNRQCEALRAGANSHLLGAMRRIEERDRERFSQPASESVTTT